MNAGAGAIPSADVCGSAEILPSAEARSFALLLQCHCTRVGTTLQIRLRAAIPMYLESRPQPLICRPAENITAIAKLWHHEPWTNPAPAPPFTVAR